MKRFWLVLLSLGLIMAFSASAFAVDVKFSGSYYVAGMYLNKVSLADPGTPNESTSFYYQRLRVQTDFIVSTGLKLITRFDAMERAWKAPRSAPGTALDETYGILNSDSAGTRAENENIAFDWAYVQYQSPIGRFEAGYMADGAWGTVFGDTTFAHPRITYMSPSLANFYIFATTVKLGENSYTNINPGITASDLDNDKDVLAFWYLGKGWNAGLLYGYFNVKSLRQALNASMKFHVLMPYFYAKLGPVTVQAEVDYGFGKYLAYEAPAVTPDKDLSSLAGWIDAQANFGPVYVGGTFAYSQGQDPNNTDKQQQLLGGGNDWSPALIMWNYDRYYWAGGLGTAAGSFGSSSVGGQFINGLLFQVRGGANLSEKFTLGASVTYAVADQKPLNYISKDYGYELDVTATYKITNNLSYMLGGGYLWTGDYFKGTSGTNSVANDYLLINKLTLTF